MSFEIIIPFLRPIEPLLDDDEISEIMCNPDSTCWIEREGTIRPASEHRFKAGELHAGLEVIANKFGKQLDASHPILNVRLPDGSRLSAIIPPVVEKLNADLKKNLTERAQALVAGVEPAVLKRAIHYLFKKETKSSFAIEGEAPSKDRTERFVSALMRADKFDPTNKQSLIELQNVIVDPRYAQKDWRDIQVYVGETLPDYSQDVHFVCPQPQDVLSLMDGWMQMMGRLLEAGSGIHPVCLAAAGGFGFVFVHPFVDGNGRIHRFLVHNVLSKMNFTPKGVLFPISAAMLRDMAAYDGVLAAFSDAIQPFIDHKMDPEHRMTVSNDTAYLYRYFDATVQTEYLFDCIEDTITRDLKAEIGFLKFFDRAIRSVMEIADMPNQRASLMVRLIHQNNGKLSKSKRQQFAELNDDEIKQIESAIQTANENAWD